MPSARRLRIARALFVSAFAEYTQYRAEFAIWVLVGALPLIMMFIWRGLAEAGPVGGYDAGDFAAYFFMAYVVRQATPIWIMSELDREIRLGELSARLLRPLNPVAVYAGKHVSELAIRLPLILPLIVAGLLATGGLTRISLPHLPAFVLALALAAAVHFAMQYALGLLAFWIDQVLALESLTFTLYMVFGGALAPLDLFPEGAREIIAWTPFPYIIHFPVAVVLGTVAGDDLLAGLAVQALWIAAFAGLAALLWRHGLGRYSAVGA